mmetsp:Transcript_9068/g.18332  ORF Transcript_9068/g.18332 Transcript_9068/m.18332 type:complete len:483 (+) Transcript_9068:50-1498(+)
MDEHSEPPLRHDPLLKNLDINDWDVIKAFWSSSSRSSTHGTPKLATGSQFTRRWIHTWQTILVFAACLMLFLVYSNLESYFEFNSTYITTLQTSRSNLVWPDVTVCNNNVLYTRDEGEQALPPDLSKYCNETTTFNESVKVLGELTASEYRKYGSNIDEFIMSCEVEGVSCKDPKYWKATVPDTFSWGLCYTLDASQFGRPTGLGVWNAIELELNLQSELYCGSIAQDVGARITLHEQGSWPDPNEGYTLAASSKYMIGIGMSKILRLGEPYTACESEKKFYPSTEPCYEKCVIQEILGICGCRYSRSLQYEENKMPFCDQSDDLQLCGEEIEYEWFQDRSASGCECPKPLCEETNFMIKSASAGLWPSQKSRKVYSDEDEGLANDYVSASIFYTKYTYEENKEKADKDFVSTLSTIGGSLGLCLGMSLVSLFEFFELLQILIRRWNKRREIRRRARLSSIRKKLVELDEESDGNELKDQTS